MEFGSSALQRELSFKPIQNIVGSKYKKIIYISIGENGNIYDGELITERSEFSPYRYQTSLNGNLFILWIMGYGSECF